nr:hypothetical protein CFP56_27862 [Quercus suber]
MKTRYVFPFSFLLFSLFCSKGLNTSLQKIIHQRQQLTTLQSDGQDRYPTKNQSNISRHVMGKRFKIHNCSITSKRVKKITCRITI